MRYRIEKYGLVLLLALLFSACASQIPRAIREVPADSASLEQVRELEHAAMEIWLRDLPDIPMFEFFNRFIRNEKYWVNWPLDTTDADPYMNGIHCHTGFPYMTLQLQPTDAE